MYEDIPKPKNYEHALKLEVQKYQKEAKNITESFRNIILNKLDQEQPINLIKFGI